MGQASLKWNLQVQGFLKSYVIVPVLPVDFSYFVYGCFCLYMFSTHRNTGKRVEDPLGTGIIVISHHEVIGNWSLIFYKNDCLYPKYQFQMLAPTDQDITDMVATESKM